MRKLLLMSILILSLSFTMCACSNDPVEETPNTPTDIPEEPETSEQSKLNAIKPTAYNRVTGLNLEPGSAISIIGKYADDSFWTQVEAGALKAVDDLNEMLGYTGDDKITLSYNAPNIRDDVNEQINILDEELSRYPIAIGIAAVDINACTLQFDLASENNIPIITFDSGSDYQHVASHISTNNKEAAATAAAKLAHSIGEAGEIAVFVHDSYSMTALDRLDGFVAELKENYPDVEVVTIYHLDEYEDIIEDITYETSIALDENNEPIDSESLTNEDIVKWILQENPNLKGIYSTNLNTTQLVADVVVGLERTDLKIVGFDGGEEQLKLLEDDVVEGLILQNPFGMGYATVVAAARVHLDMGNESRVDTGYIWVTKDNMEEISIANMLY